MKKIMHNYINENGKLSNVLNRDGDTAATVTRLRIRKRDSEAREGREKSVRVY